MPAQAPPRPPDLDELKDALIEEARRRARRRRLGYAVAIAGSLALVAGIYLAAGGGGGGKAPPPEPAGRGPTPSATSHGVKVKLEPGWHAARESLTPRLVHPKELLSVGTFPMRPGGQCAQLPARAYADMGPKDGLITIMQEGGKRPGFPPRPARFRFPTPPRFFECAPPELRVREFVFSDGGRSFYAFVALGAPGPIEEARSILNSLSVARRTP